MNFPDHLSWRKLSSLDISMGQDIWDSQRKTVATKNELIVKKKKKKEKEKKNN